MVRTAALLLTFLTGFSALVYEVAWQRYLATLLGSHSEATAAVLALFLGGLALGYSLFGRATRRRVARARLANRPARLLAFYGLVEAGIGAYALLFPYFFKVAQAFSLLVPLGYGGLGFALDVGLSALLIGPPAVLMGGTIPILTQALARSLADATRFHALVYGSNTAGAFAGALAAGYWLVPQLGLVGVLVAMAVVNLGAGAAFAALGWREPATAATQSVPEPGAVPRVEGLTAFATIALLVGFAMMAVQTVLIRLAGLSFGASQFTFSMVVAAFVLCIALGSFAVSALARIPTRALVGNLWALLLLLYLLYSPLKDSPYWAHVLRSLFRDQAANFYPFHFAAFAGVTLAIGLPVALSGATLPLIFHHLRREVGDLGNAAGRLYSWNTLGSLLGALLGGYALLYWLDLHHVFRLAMVAVVAAAALATLRLLPAGRIVAGGALPVALVAVLLLPPWPADRLASGLFRERQPLEDTLRGPDLLFASRPKTRVLFYDDDPTASVAVKELRSPNGEGDRNIVTNGKSDGSLEQDYVTMGLAALLPALMAKRAQRAFVIGYGTGVTAGEFAALDSAREVLVAEISPGVIRAARYFEHGNQGAGENPKVRIVQGDAYRVLLRSKGSFDVIASEPSNPWVTGVEMLYSREFLEAARDRLSPGGVYAQWFHLYETDAETVAMVFRTYAAVFNHVAVWFAKGRDLLLLGLRDPETALNLDRLGARMKQRDFAAGLARCDVHNLPELLAHELLPLGVLHAAAPHGELHTLLHPRLSQYAARAFFVGGVGQLPITASLEATRAGRRNSLVQRYAARHGGQIPEEARGLLVAATCAQRPRQCVTLLAHWTHEVPRSATRERIKAQIRDTPKLAAKTRLALVRPLSRLYDAAPPAPEGQDSLQAAKQATDRFSAWYHHAAPFPRSTIANLWQRCAAEDVTQRSRCLESRAKAEESLGSFNAKLDGSRGGEAR